MDIGRIKELSKILTQKQEKPKNNIIFGTVVSSNENGVTVQLDGADDPIPVESVTEVNANDRVMVQFNNHVASILGNVSDKSITRTTADGLIDVFANNGTFSGTLSAATGSFSGTVTASELTARNATLYGDNDGITVSISDAVNIVQALNTAIRAGLKCEGTLNSVTYKTEITPSSLRFSRTDVSNNGIIAFTGSSGTGEITVQNADLSVFKDLYVSGVVDNIKTMNSILVPNGGGITACMHGDSPDGQSITALDLIKLSSADNVIINGSGSGYTRVMSELRADSAIKSTGGAVIANNCTAWDGGTAGGYISTGGRLALVSGSSSDYPNIVFVKNKNTNANTTLRANNTGSTTYTLTLPNSTGTLAVASSDKRLKENIKPSEVSGLELINKIELKQFDWKPEGKEGAPHWDIGMIADELEQLDKNLVFGGGDNEDGTMNVKGIDTLCLVSYLVKSVQELSAEVKALRGEADVK